MLSRLEQLSDFVMLVSHKENHGKWLDVLAVVEAARGIADTARRGKSTRECGVPLESMEILDATLAKLDEVQS